MPQRARYAYAGYDPDSSTSHLGPDPLDEHRLRDERLKALEEDNRRLKAAVRGLEGALKIVSRVSAPMPKASGRGWLARR